MNKSKKIYDPFQIVLFIVFTVLCALVIFPFLLTVSVSLSSEKNIAYFGYSIIPRKVDFAAYRYVFSNPNAILSAYRVTIFFSLVSMVLSVLFMSMIAYALSRKIMTGKNAVSFFLYFTMLFSGGLVPTYILITQYLHLNDTIWVYIIPSLISPWYIFMLRTFFADLPEEMLEAAIIDGASEFRMLFKIVMPLSKPAIATVALFMVLAKWNDWMTSMLYINDESLISLQYLLQRIMQNIQMLQEQSMDISSLMDIKDIPSESARMAMAVVVAGPALIVFPFFQKYFVRGLTVGGVKG